MSTLIAILGGVGLFLLGMTVMTTGLKSLAGSALRIVLGKAAATPLRGAFWGAVITLLVQSSSATVMTTIGLVSAGLLTFPQGLSLVLGANVGTTGTGWLVALIGVRVSLTAFALPVVFTGALIKLLTSGRVSGVGAAIAGFGLVLYGLTTLQQGMGGLAERLHPADLPAVLSGADSGWWGGTLGVLLLVVAGLVMTTLMQSSTAAIAVTMSAYFAGAIGLDQACALIIGQNIGTATSSAIAAIGASATAKRVALAYVLFKVLAAIIALLLFPFVIPLLLRASNTVDGVTLLALYHTAFNAVGVAVLLPMIARFTAIVERILPERGSSLTRCLDPSALATPIVAVEAVRRTIARALGVVCGTVGNALKAAGHGEPLAKGTYVAQVDEAADALNQAQIFLSEVDGPPSSDDEQRRLTSTIHALDHASRLAELARADIDFLSVAGGRPEDQRAIHLCQEAMRNALAVANDVVKQAGISTQTHTEASVSREAVSPNAVAASSDDVFADLGRRREELTELRRPHRSVTLSAVAEGTLTVGEALARADTVRSLEALGHHAWRAVAHLTGRVT